MRSSTIVAIAAVLWSASAPPGAQAAQRLMDVRQVAADTLPDVAMAAFVEGRPTIYYNPDRLQRFGPRMTEFFFAHEYGHIRYGHAGGALAHEEDELTLVRQRQELEADCYAARVLAERDREAVDAALRFFTRMGPYRYDVWHPTGSQRAAKILSCLPDLPEPTAESVAEGRPAGASEAAFVLRSPAASAGEYAMEATVWIDDVRVGTVSSLRQPGSIAVHGFQPGAHRYRVALTLYGFDAMLQLNHSGSASGEGLVLLEDGAVFSIRRRAGEAPTLVRQ